MRIQFFLTAALILSAGSSLTAQDLKQALSRMQKLYAKSDRLHIVMRIEAFENETATAPYYHEQADLKREGTNYRYLFGATEMLLNERFLVMVDKSAREIMYNTRNASTSSSFVAEKPLDLDSLFRFYESPQYLGRKDQTDHYRIIQKKGPVDQVELLVHTETGFLTGINYRYRKGPLVSIAFLKFDAQPTFGPEEFNDTHYLIHFAGGVQASANFKHYHVSQARTP